MQAWKPLLLILPAGLLLGMIGGRYAHPVMQQRGGDEPWRQMLEPNIRPSNPRIMVENPPIDPMPYGPSSSFAEQATVEWPDPYAGTRWDPASAEPLPSVAELDAQLDSSAGEANAEPAPAARLADAGTGVTVIRGGEPRRDDGALTAIY